MTDPELTRPPVRAWQRLLSRPMQFVLDVGVLLGVFVLSYAVRFEFELDPETWLRLLTQAPMVVLIQFSALFVAGVYSFVWRYVGMAELKAFVKAAFWSGVVLLGLRLGLPDALGEWRVPLSIIAIDTVFAFGGVLNLRVLRRALYERYERAKHEAEGRRKPVLLVGAGQAGNMAVKEIRGRRDTGLEVRGFVDDDPEKAGTVIQGVKVLGTSRDIPKLVGELAVDHVVITIAQASRKDIRRIVDICESVPVRARIIPGLYEILGGDVEISRIRDVSVEDLLGREAVRLEEDEVARFIRGKVVMVTGAGGSIGAEMARQVARFEPSRLLLVERAEFALFEIDRELREAWPQQALVPVVGDVCDELRMRSVFATHPPAVVFHAAAHKHVPMMEANPTEAVKNNILGTELVGRLAGETGADAFVMVSTDKAVRPTSVMGASKRVAELVVQELDRLYQTRYVSVRFGNVMGSAGSVIPIFRRQIEDGGPVTVTHPEMVRYFMTIPEASQLVLQAGAMGEGGEIFILDMGEPIRILDLAKDMITLSGLKPYEDIDIVFSGIRPGEKLFEELQTTGENVANTRHPKVYIGRVEPYPPERIEAALGRLGELSVNGHEREIRTCLAELLPEARLNL